MTAQEAASGNGAFTIVFHSECSRRAVPELGRCLPSDSLMSIGHLPRFEKTLR
jgi:hypothetical protein